MKGIFKWLERLSLDAVVVAVVWGIVLDELIQQHLDCQNLFILALSTWLTYVADRLRDVGSGRVVPGTDRHLFYKSNYRFFKILWIIGFLVDVLLAFLWLPSWKVLYGFTLVLGIIGYLVLVGKISSLPVRIAFKRLAVPIIFTAGVGWMAESWRTTEGQHASLVLLVAAIANLLVISDWEHIGKKEIPWLLPALLGSLFLMVMTGFAGLLGALCFGTVALLARRRSVLYVRAIADGVLVLMALAVWVWM